MRSAVVDVQLKQSQLERLPPADAFRPSIHTHTKSTHTKVVSRGSRGGRHARRQPSGHTSPQAQGGAARPSTQASTTPIGPGTRRARARRRLLAPQFPLPLTELTHRPARGPSQVLYHTAKEEDAGVHMTIRAWDPEEDDIIMSMHAKEGERKIVEHPRPHSSVRNRWQRIEKGATARRRRAQEPCHSWKSRSAATSAGRARAGRSRDRRRSTCRRRLPCSATPRSRDPHARRAQGGWLGGGPRAAARHWLGGCSCRRRDERRRLATPGRCLKRTRSGSRLVPSGLAQPSAPPPLSANVGVAINHNDVAAAAAGAAAAATPRLQRSDVLPPRPRKLRYLLARQPWLLRAVDSGATRRRRPEHRRRRHRAAERAARRRGEQCQADALRLVVCARPDGRGPATGAAGGVVASSSSPWSRTMEACARPRHTPRCRASCRSPRCRASRRSPRCRASRRSPRCRAAVALARLAPAVGPRPARVSSFLRDFMDESAALDLRRC